MTFSKKLVPIRSSILQIDPKKIDVVVECSFLGMNYSFFDTAKKHYEKDYSIYHLRTVNNC